MHSTYADADGVRIHVLDHGGEGESLVCVHATGFHARLWDPYVPALRERFRVVALDQRGHGDSDKPTSGYEWRHFGRDVLAAVGHLGLERPLGIGHSAGAAALVFAETLQPGTFERLVLMDPVTPRPDVRGFMAEANPLAAGARRRRRVWDTAGEMVDRLKERGPLTGWSDELLRAYVEHGTRALEDGRLELKCPPEVEAQIYEMGGRHDGWERLAELGCPTLLLVGEHSDLWRPGTREEAAERIPRGRLETVPGGHFFPMESPHETRGRVLAFLGEG